MVHDIKDPGGFKNYAVRIYRTEVAETFIRARTPDEAMDKAADKVEELEFSELSCEVSDVVHIPPGVNYQIREPITRRPRPVACDHEWADPENEKVISNGWEVCVKCGDLKPPHA